MTITTYLLVALIFWVIVVVCAVVSWLEDAVNGGEALMTCILYCFIVMVWPLFVVVVLLPEAMSWLKKKYKENK